MVINSMAIHLKSQNVRGLQDSLKRRQIFHTFQLSKFHIFLLQETHSSLQMEQQWKNEWGGEIYFSHGATNSRGVCILLKNTFSRVMHRIVADDCGRFVIVDLEINSLRLLIGTIYGPNRDDPDFYIKFIETIEGFDNANCIIGGDWNFVLDLEFDKKGGLSQTNTLSREIIKSWMDESDLIDIWRQNYPNDFKFTWKRLRPLPGIFCRLDFILLSYGLADKIENTDIVPGIKSDHSALTLSFVTVLHKKGPGYWKLNCSYLKDADFIEGVKNTISDTVELNPNTNPMLLWDTIKCQIRGFSVNYSAKKKKSKINIIQVLEKRLQRLENILTETWSAEVEQQVNQVKEELDKYLEDKTKGAMIRSRCRWYEEGEKSTKYFLNLEKRNFNNKNLDRLMLQNGDISTNCEQILEEEKRFYQKLYTTTHLVSTVEERIPDFLGNNIDAPIISEENKLNLEGNISEQEIANAIKSTANNKAPGLDGLPIEFYKIFWGDIKFYFMQSINQSYQQNHLSISQKQGLINLIPKKDKDPLNLKNWRPLSLLNADYKLIAKVIATRIKTYLNDIIHTNQTGFLADRFIGENIVKALSIIEFAEEENIPALLMFVDYEKAFDTVEWDFVLECLRFFNFGDTIINWVKILYTGINSCVVNNGWFSDFFQPSRGVRQGCPLSPYLFIIAAEIFAISIRKNDKIKGIVINGDSSKIEQYADDTYMAFLFEKESLDQIINTLDKFQIISGLKVNYDKTEILRIGSLKNSEAKLYTQKNLKWTNDPANLLGINVGTNLGEVTEQNFEKLIKKMENITKIWLSRQLTLIGRIVIIKTFLVSQLIYSFSVLPSPSPVQMKRIDKILNDHLWSHKKHYIEKNVMLNCLSEGGLNMIDIYSKNIATKCKWVKKITDTTVGFFNNIVNYFIPNSNRLFWSGNLNVADGFKLMKHNSLFWKSVVQAWCIYNFYIPSNLEEIYNQQIWYNSCILIKGKPFFYNHLYTKGITYIKDLMNDDGYIMSVHDILAKYRLNYNWIMVLNGIIDAVPQQWKLVLNANHHIDYNNLQYVSNFQKLVTSPNTTKFVYQSLVKKRAVAFSDRLVDKWSEDLHPLSINRTFISNCFDLIMKSTISPKHRAFQFRLIHRILVTNKMLNDWKIIDNNACSFCNAQPETIFHMLWECTVVQTLWTSLFEWLEQITESNIRFNAKEILLGIEDNTFIMYNAVFILMKQFIYARRCQNLPLNIIALKNNIRYYIQIEKYIAVKNNKLEYHDYKWALLQT